MTRPALHFTAHRGWINDPHGLTWHDGRYHLFHQLVPDSPVWAPRCEWGHATSTDLLTWTHHDPVLRPGDGDDGIWTGCLVDRGADSRILYTSVSHPDLAIGRVRTARPLDSGWDRWAKGPVVVDPPPDLDLVAFRDPVVLQDDAATDPSRRWRMFVGGGTRDGEAVALTWVSADLDTWAYDGVAVARSTRETEPAWTGSLWECPQVVAVDDHWAMVTSVWDADVLHHAAYGLGGPGAYRDGRLDVDTWGRLSFGTSYYAPSVFRDRDGRPGLIFWMRGVADADQSWAGCLSVPYWLGVRDGRLVVQPHPQVAAARRGPAVAGPLAGPLDVAWSPAPEDRLTLDSGPDSNPRTTTTVRVSGGAVVLARADTVVGTVAETGAQTMPWSGGDLRVLVDGPVVEVCGADGVLGGPIEPPTAWRAPRGRYDAWSLGAGMPVGPAGLPAGPTTPDERTQT